MLTTFIIFNILNVIIQTVKSICTVKCNKWVAAIVNAVAYGLYTYIIVLTNADLDLFIKIGVVASANLIGVFFVKLVEEKSQKDKLWKVEATVLNKFANALEFDLRDVPHNYVPVGKHTLFNFYCSTQKESAKVKRIVEQYGAKFFVAESRVL